MALRVVDAAGLVNNDEILNPPQSPVALIKSGVKLIASAFKPAKPPLTPDQAREAQRQQIAAALQDDLKVERVTRSSVVSVSFDSTDPQLAAKVTRAYADCLSDGSAECQFRRDRTGFRLAAGTVDRPSPTFADRLRSMSKNTRRTTA